ESACRRSLQPLSPIQNNSDLAQGPHPIRPSKVPRSDIYLAPGGVHGTETKTSYRRDGSCDGVDHPSGHDVGGGSPELVIDLPPLPSAFVLGGRPAFCLRSRTPASRRLRPAVTPRQPTPLCSSGRRPCALRARDTYPASKMSSPGALRLLPLLTAHSTWQHLQSLEDKERRPSREAS